MSKIWQICTVLLVLTPYVFAENAESITSENTDMAGYAANGIGAKLGFDWGLGNVRDQSKTNPSRKVNTFAIGGLAGYKFMGIMPGIHGEYRWIGQNSDPNYVSGYTNVRGKSWLAGLGALYAMNAWEFFVNYDFFGKYNLTNKTITGLESKYAKPKAWRLGAGYALNSLVGLTERYPITVEGSFQYITWSENELGTTVADISSDKLQQWNYALGFSVRY